jgi:hypothetical protein
MGAGITEMTRIRLATIAALWASTALSMAAPAAPAADLDEVMSYDGLQKISVPGIDLAYALPGATLAGYSKVQLEPVTVSFHKDWKPTKPGTRFRLSTKDQENIRTGLAKIVYDEFAKQIQDEGGYRIVNSAGPDVLRVKPNIINLYIAAPDVASSKRVRSYTLSAGEMTLFAELSDSETGEVLARMVDRREARNPEVLTLTKGTTNTAEARAMAARWAGILRDALDKSRGIGRN